MPMYYLRCHKLVTGVMLFVMFLLVLLNTRETVCALCSLCVNETPVPASSVLRIASFISLFFRQNFCNSGVAVQCGSGVAWCGLQTPDCVTRPVNIRPCNTTPPAIINVAAAPTPPPVVWWSQPRLIVHIVEWF